MNLTFPVVVQGDGEGGFVGEVPDVPGTRTFWPTREEVLYWIQDAWTISKPRLPCWASASRFALSMPRSSQPEPKQ